MELDSGTIAANCIKFTILVVLVLTYVFWGEWYLMGFVYIAAVPACFSIAYLLGLACSIAGIELIDSEDATAGDEDGGDEEDRFLMDPEKFIISEETVGVYMGERIPAFIIISPPGLAPIKLFWDCICDSVEFEPPSDGRWHVRIEPGLLYIESPTV